MGHVITKMHAREEMTTKAFDLHCDGTSRSRENFVGQQITLADNTTLSLGFQLTAREDAQSLLDLTLRISDELHYLDFDARGEEQLKDMLRNMVGIMTDRANVMKSFQEAVEAKKKEILQSEEGITRLLQCPLSSWTVSSCLQSLNVCGKSKGLPKETRT